MSIQDFYSVPCPYCGQQVDIEVDASIGRQQRVEDCQICCRPILLTINFDSDGKITIDARQENE